MPAKITLNENGPAKIEGEFTVVDKAGNEYNVAGKLAVFLCRCGQTANAPFCDGAHKSCGFVSPSAAR